MSRPNSLDDRDTLVSLGYLYAEDLGELRLYHYTRRCVRDRAWNEVTLNSRGHIFHRGTGECVARPFTKFFGLGELGIDEAAVPWDEAELVTEKLDGWMGTLFRLDGEPRVATSGSMTSHVAKMASCLLSGRHFNLDGLDDRLTLVWELLAPETRVVIDYGPEWRMVLLAAFDRHTGDELSWTELGAIAGRYGFELPRVVWAAGDAARLAEAVAAELGRPGVEGVVVRFRDGSRLRIKTDAYQAALTARNQDRKLHLTNS